MRQHSSSKNTEILILDTFSKLMSEYGYNATTTKKIALTAGINESTIFRHFPNKKHLMKALIEQYLIDIEEVKRAFKITGDIRKDLVKVTNIYNDFINDHAALFLAGIRDRELFPELERLIQQLPLKFKEVLFIAFKEMQVSGEIKQEINLKAEATNFMLVNFGYLTFKLAYPNSPFDVPTNKFTKENVIEFAKHLE